MFLEVSFVHEVFTSLNCFTLLYSQCSATDDLLLRFARARPSVRHTVGRVVRSPGYMVARSPVFSKSSRISAPASRLPDRSQNLPFLTRRSPASEINVLETYCSLL